MAECVDLSPSSHYLGDVCILMLDLKTTTNLKTRTHAQHSSEEAS